MLTLLLKVTPVLGWFWSNSLILCSIKETEKSFAFYKMNLVSCKVKHRTCLVTQVLCLMQLCCQSYTIPHKVNESNSLNIYSTLLILYNIKAGRIQRLHAWQIISSMFPDYISLKTVLKKLTFVWKSSWLPMKGLEEELMSIKARFVFLSKSSKKIWAYFECLFCIIMSRCIYVLNVSVVLVVSHQNSVLVTVRISGVVVLPHVVRQVLSMRRVEVPDGIISKLLCVMNYW